MTTQQLLMPLVLVGLVLLTLTLSGLARRYQQQQAARRSVVRRMETGLRLIEGLLEELGKMPISGELRRSLRQDAINRYEMIGKVFRKYPNLEQLTEEAQARLNAESRDSVGGIPEILDSSELKRMLTRIGDLVNFVAGNDLISPPPKTKRKEFVRHLREHSAELISRHHHANFENKRDAGDLEAARQHLRLLMKELETRGPNTEKVLDLYKAAKTALTESRTQAAPEHFADVARKAS